MRLGKKGKRANARNNKKKEKKKRREERRREERRKKNRAPFREANNYIYQLPITRPRRQDVSRSSSSLREFCSSISHVILVQARVRVGKMGKVKHRFRINHDGAGRCGEVGTLDPTFQMGNSLGKMVPF